MHFFLKGLATPSDGVGMSDTNRHMTHRRPPARAIAAPPMGAPPAVTAASRVEALRQLVAAGQYQVSARWLATRIFRAAGVNLPKP
jgi:anti-sigma28 factor (negative regulator of flagellin synthesis)